MGHEIRGQGPETLVLVSALGATRAVWEPQVEYFERDYTVISIDGGGHGPPAIDGEPRSLLGFADEVVSAAAANGAFRFHLAGISMGGMLGQLLAIRHPSMLKSLVLISTTPYYPTESRNALGERAETAEREGMKVLADATVARWLTPEFRLQRPDVTEQVRQMLDSADASRYAEAARAVSKIDIVRELCLIVTPTLILRGERDESLPDDASALLAENIPEARTASIAGAAHLCTLEKPDEVNEEMGTFLKGVTDA